ncbi:MAG: histone family protein [Hadesarchaea archaeon]|nr:histone family protein [Hadesarchaea archaeon]
MTELPIAAVDRIIRKAGARRVSEGAAEALAEVLEERALSIASEASRLAEHAGRKTVRDVDVRLASKRASEL